jgi:hypothetical protein
MMYTPVVHAADVVSVAEVDQFAHETRPVFAGSLTQAGCLMPVRFGSVPIRRPWSPP